MMRSIAVILAEVFENYEVCRLFLLVSNFDLI